MPGQNPPDRLILQQLSQGEARTGALARALNVSDETVRRALARLAAQGLVARVHGGAHLRDAGGEASFSQRMGQNQTAKRRIAAAVAKAVPDGSTLFLDVGSTTAFVAQALRVRRELLVVTNSLAVAQALTGHGGNRVFMAGGELRAHDGGAFGTEALAFLGQFRLGLAVLSVAAVTPPAGFLLQDLREAEFSRLLMNRAETTIVAADAAKFGRAAPIAIAPPERFAQLVTDAAPGRELAAFLAEAGVKVTLA